MSYQAGYNWSAISCSVFPAYPSLSISLGDFQILLKDTSWKSLQMSFTSSCPPLSFLSPQKLKHKSIFPQKPCIPEKLNINVIFKNSLCIRSWLQAMKIHSDLLKKKNILEIYVIQMTQSIWGLKNKSLGKETRSKEDGNCGSNLMKNLCEMLPLTLLP